MSSNSNIDLDRLRRLAEGATPGPWEVGNRYLIAGCIYDGGTRCGYCSPDNPLIWEGRRDINGEMMKAHVHTGEPYSYHTIVTFDAATGEAVTIAGNYDYEDGGIISLPDADFIAACSPETILGLLNMIGGVTDAAE